MFIICVFALLSWSVNGISIEEFGAVADDYTLETAEKNSQAFMKTVLAANHSYDKVIEIPAGREYFMLDVYVYDIYGVTFLFNGNILFSDTINAWVNQRTGIFSFNESHHLFFSGNGKLDGNGLKWWRSAYLGNSYRPDMFYFYQCTDIHISDVNLFNSPRFTIYFKDCAHIIIHDITIFIDSAVTHKDVDSATYALNTDGIDIGAYNVTIYNCNITNYDDAIVPKPCRSNYKYCQCASNILAYNNTISYSTGLTIGSVPPNDHVNCVRDVVFRDTFMYRPLKALYLKSNPGDTGTGIVENILYENIRIYQALWWTIYLGPQQQNEPNDGSDGTGCNFLFPFIPDCPTQPLVTIRNITFRNIVATETVPTFEGPGILLCDPANPCTDITFENVTNTVFSGDIDDIIAELPIYAPGVIFPTKYRSDDWVFEYLTSNVYGQNIGLVYPPVCFDESCFWDGKSKH